MTYWPCQSEEMPTTYYVARAIVGKKERSTPYLVLETVEEAKSLEAEETEQSGRFVICLERLRNSASAETRGKRHGCEQNSRDYPRVPRVNNLRFLRRAKGAEGPLPAIMGTPHRRSSAHQGNNHSGIRPSPSKFATAKKKKMKTIPTCAPSPALLRGRR